MLMSRGTWVHRVQISAIPRITAAVYVVGLLGRLPSAGRGLGRRRLVRHGREDQTDSTHPSRGPTHLGATVQTEVGGARTGVDGSEADWLRTPSEQKNALERSSALGTTRTVSAAVWNWTPQAATLIRTPSREATAPAGSRIAQTDWTVTARAEQQPPVAAPSANGYVCVVLPMTLKTRTRLARKLRNRTRSKLIIAQPPARRCRGLRRAQ
jgi:hypothetical protein